VTTESIFTDALGNPWPIEPNPLIAELRETKELLRAALAENSKLKAEKLLADAAFEALKKKLEAAETLLARLYGWDMMDSAADAPYWREEMRKLGIRHPDPAREAKS